jgi:hypothetical protein
MLHGRVLARKIGRTREERRLKQEIQCPSHKLRPLDIIIASLTEVAAP